MPTIHRYILGSPEGQAPIIRDTQNPSKCNAYYKSSKSVLLTGLKQKLLPTMYSHHYLKFPHPYVFLKKKKKNQHPSC